ncbi:MAG: galactokinase [Gemmatimonadaceae bacterium]
MTAADARRHFTKSFGGAPDLVVSAAGRVNLIGEHVDYNGGWALPIAIQRRTAIAIRLCAGSNVTRINSGGTGGVLTLDHAELQRRRQWTDYPSGVLDQLVGDGVSLPGFEVAVASDVPSGSGLSSSAALEVAFGFAVRTILGLATDKVRLALLCQRAEREFVGVPCGAMDQLSAACGVAGHALHMGFSPVFVKPVPFTEKVLVFDTAVPRNLRGSAYEDRVKECAEAVGAIQRVAPAVHSLAVATLEQVEAAEMGEVPRRRARHVVGECARVRQAVATLATGASFPGEVALASHASLRDDYDCSSAELDWVVTHAMRQPGIHGARLTGAGWGGCAVIFGEAGALEEAQRALAADYEAAFRIRPRGWIVSADDGARVEA